MIYAVLVGGRYYYLVFEGFWLCAGSERSWDGLVTSVGDPVRIAGYVSHKLGEMETALVR